MRIGSGALRVVIIVLAVLLALSSTALACTVLCRENAQNTHTATEENIISTHRGATVSLSIVPMPAYASVPLSATADILTDCADGSTVTLKLYRGREQDTAAFAVENMFPGDRIRRVYTLEVSRSGSVTVHFRTDVRQGYEVLAQVLKCRVVLDDTELYDGLMKEMPQRISHTLPAGSGTAKLDYDIEVYLDTSVGNEYQNKELYADFNWWVEEENCGFYPSYDSSDPDVSDRPGQLIPPKTGDELHLCFWFWVAMASLLLNIALLTGKLMKKENKQEAQS